MIFLISAILNCEISGETNVENYSVQHRQEMDGDICLTTLEKNRDILPLSA